MAKFTPIALFASIRGKLDSHSKWATALRLGVQYFLRIGKRNFFRHPKTKEERKTQQRLRQASLDYNQLDKSSEQYKAYLADFEEQVKQNKCYPLFRTYFISRRMAELKAEGNLAADPTKNKQDWSLKHRH